MIRILFICHGNICRSTMAEFVMKDLVRKEGLTDKIEVASAATSRDAIGSDTYPGTKAILRKYHIPFTKRAAVQITPEDFQKYDYLVVMDNNNLRNLAGRIPAGTEQKITKLLFWINSDRDVADPWYTGDFETTYEDVKAGCEALLQAIKDTIKK